MSLTDIIAIIAAIVAALGGAFVGNLWGRMRGEERGRTETLREVERQQGNAYRQTIERTANAPRASSAADARDRLRSRLDPDK